MALLLQCKSCQATYPDTRGKHVATYFHVCPEKIVEQPEAVDADHNIVKPATFKAVENPRDENLKPHPEKPGEFVMVSEGNGVTKLE